MMKNKIDSVFVLIVFAVFALSVLMVLMLGAGVYKNISQTTQDGYDERTALSYIWTKVKSFDEEGQIYIGDFYGISALFIDEDFDGLLLRTAIYHYDGQLRELFSEPGLGLMPEDGIAIIKSEGLTFEQIDSGLIKISTAARDLFISLRSVRMGDV